MHKVCIGPSVFIVLLVTECAMAISAGAKQAPTPSLLDLAKETFGEQNLTAAERSLFESAQAGKGAFVSIKDASEANLETASTWSGDRVVHAERLAWLCTDPRATTLVSYRGLSLFGMRIEGDLELWDSEIKFPLYANKCVFTGKINLQRSQLRTLHFRTCIINGLQASGLSVTGAVSLNGGCKSQGEINFAGANIGGNLECDGSQFMNPSGQALKADGTNIRGYVLLGAGFKADGEVNFVGATIDHDLNCCGAQLSTPGGKALNASGVKVDGVVSLCGAKTNGEIILLGATIGGVLNCNGAELTNPQEYALTADGMKIEGAVFLSDKAKIEGGVRFLGAEIGGDLNCQGAQFSNPSDKALNASTAKIDGNVFLDGAFKAKGEINFAEAVIGGTLSCQGAQLSNENQQAYALVAERAKINGTVYLDEGFKAQGQIGLAEAHIGGSLLCVDAQFLNPNGIALNAFKAKVDGGVLLGTGFKANGEVCFAGATLGSFAGHGAQISNPGKYALNAQGVKIEGGAFLRGGFQADGIVIFASAKVAGDFEVSRLVNLEKTILDLRSAKVETFLDSDHSWPTVGKLFLDGFTYERLSALAPLDAKSRLEWLHREGTFLPQPYEQLASVLLKMGHEQAAKEVMMRKNHDHAKHIEKFFRAKPFFQRFGRFLTQEWWWYNVFGKWIGYGYRPGRAFMASLGFIALGTLLFRFGYARDIVSPQDDKGYERDSVGHEVWSHGRRAVVNGYPRFNALVYSLESFIPLVKLDQSANWAPNANLGARLSIWQWKLTTGGLLRGYLYFHIMAGWVLTTLWVGAITGLVKS